MAAPPTTTDRALLARLDAAFAARAAFVDEAHESAFRLVNGHLEGAPDWVIDAYATTAVIHHHGAPRAADDPLLARVADALRAHHPWLRTIILKERKGPDDARRGRVVFAAARTTGEASRGATEVREHGVRYALDLQMHQDDGFYLDTRGLRRWLIAEGGGASVLNTFAYTGSLGVAARAGGATRVVQTDLNARFLRLARASYALNGFEHDPKDVRAQDFWSFVRGSKLRNDRYDLVLLDPPFFSSTRGGRLDLNRDTTKLVNRVRPLVTSGGRLVVVHNSLFVTGAEFMRDLERLSVGGWVAVEETIDVPEDVTGFASTRHGTGVADPAPFNHSTKIVVLRVRHR